MMKKWMLLLGFFSFQRSKAQVIIKDTLRPAFQWSVPVIDLPFTHDAAQTEANRRSSGNAQTSSTIRVADFGKAYRNLSMDQATEMARNLHGTLYYINNAAWYKWIRPSNTRRYILNRVLANATALGTDYLAAKLPYGYAFQHEEFHRSVMSGYGIYSYDEVWRFGKGWDIAVTRVKDEDLIFLKDRHPAAQVRLAAAGVEGEYAYFLRMHRDNFFNRTGYPFTGLGILGTFHAINYVGLPLQKKFNAITDSILVRDKQDILARDFTGYDFSAWVYDLFLPEEPYVARGGWPDGIGIKRPVKETELTQEMKTFLRTTANMQYLNLVSPFMIGINRIRINNSLTANFALRSVPASFGYFAGGDFFLEMNDRKMLVSAGINKSKQLTLPDISVQFVDLRLRKDKLTADAGVAAWLQPRDQLFFAKKAAPGFSLNFRPEYRLSKHTGIAADLSYKTKGWQFGNPYLDQNLSGRLKLQINTGRYFKR